MAALTDSVAKDVESLLALIGHLQPSFASNSASPFVGLFSYHFVHMYILRQRYRVAFPRP
jgi:hypothetical protein